MNIIQKTINNILGRNAVVTTESLWALAMSWNMENGTLLEVTPESAQRLNTVYSCVKLITDTYSIISPKIKFETDKGIFVDPKHDQNALLKKQPNKRESAINFRIELIANYLYTGHGYAKIIKNSVGRPVEWKLLPTSCVNRMVDREDNLLYYQYTQGGILENIQIPDMIDIADIYGKSRITQNAHSLQEYHAIRQYGTDMFKNGSFISGYIFGDKPLDQQGRDALLRAFKERNKNGETAILPHGYKYEPLRHNIPMGDAAMVMAKTTSDRDVCRIFGVPPSLIGVNEAADNKGESDFNSFLTTTIAPICVLVESELNRKIFRTKEENYFVSHDLSEAYRFSLKERMESYRIGIHSGIMNADEARAKIGMNPTEDGSGKEFMKPLNMIPASQWASYYENQISNRNGTVKGS